MPRPFLLACTVLAACSSSTAEVTPDAMPDAAAVPACVAYGGPPSDGHLPYDASAASTTYPRCAPRCGASTAFDGFPRASALPTGACEGASTCDMPAVPTCGCTEDRGPVNGYRCTCESGTWRCVVVSQGGSICRDRCA